MPSFQRPSPQTIGAGAAVITVLIWASFIVVARASAQHTLTAFDIAFCRVVGAGMVLLPWGWWLVRRRGTAGWLGLSPLPFAVTAAVKALVGHRRSDAMAWSRMRAPLRSLGESECLRLFAAIDAIRAQAAA